jgi:hypothetical protein
MVGVPVEFAPRGSGPETEKTSVIDTLIFEPNLLRFSVVWRAHLLLRRNIFEVTEIVAGRMPHGYYRARAAGKTYYGSMRELTTAGPVP